MKTTTPATGSAKWMADATEAGLAVGSALLSINDQVYWVKRAGAGVTLEALGSGKTYAVEVGAGRCSCPDHQYRGRACKHLGACRAALAKIAG